MSNLAIAAKAVKVTVPLDPATLAALPEPRPGTDRVTLVITCEDAIFSASISAKSLRKARSTIAEYGAENIFCVVQGKLKGKEIVECGLVAQLKAKPQAAPAPSAAA
jgi:hypothetical protein